MTDLRRICKGAAREEKGVGREVGEREAGARSTPTRWPTGREIRGASLGVVAVLEARPTPARRARQESLLHRRIRADVVCPLGRGPRETATGPSSRPLLSSRTPRSGEPGSLADSPPGPGDRRKRSVCGARLLRASAHPRRCGLPTWPWAPAGQRRDRTRGRAHCMGSRGPVGMTVPKAAGEAFA